MAQPTPANFFAEGASDEGSHQERDGGCRGDNQPCLWKILAGKQSNHVADQKEHGRPQESQQVPAQADSPTNNRAQQSAEPTTGRHECSNEHRRQRRSVGSELNADPGHDWHGRREGQLAEVKPVEEEGQHADARNREKREGPGAYDAVLRLRSRRARRFGRHDC